MFWNQKPPAKIFISYRRDDTRWVAGRLIDSLRAYFGEDRVFRDIEGIQGGAEFGNVIHHTMAAADAVVVLIGPGWLSATNDKGEKRLHDPGDWVAREIASALVKGIPVYPVLVENTPMPRAEDLPVTLQGLVERNAVSIADQRWQSDVTRLAKIVAIDIPGSVAERTLNRVRLVVSLGLFASVSVTTAIFVWNVFRTIPGLTDTQQNLLIQLFSADKSTAASTSKPPCYLQVWQSGITYVFIMASSNLLLMYARLVDASRRNYIYASGLIGALGTLLFFILLWPVGPDTAEPVFMFFGSTIIATAMFMTMNLSGFKPK